MSIEEGIFDRRSMASRNREVLLRVHRTAIEKHEHPLLFLFDGSDGSLGRRMACRVVGEASFNALLDQMAGGSRLRRARCAFNTAVGSIPRDPRRRVPLPGSRLAGAAATRRMPRAGRGYGRCGFGRAARGARVPGIENPWGPTHRLVETVPDSGKEVETMIALPVLSGQDCPRFNCCNAAICPLDSNWREVRHLPGEKVCFYLLASGKYRAQQRLVGDPVYRVVQQQAPSVCSIHAAIQRAVEAASRAGFRAANLPGNAKIRVLGEGKQGRDEV